MSNAAQVERREAKLRRRAESRRTHEARREARAERDAELTRLHAEYVAKVEKVWRKWRAAK